MKQVAVGMVVRDGLVLTCRRLPNAAYPLKWEFPGGKIEPGETPPQALFRELREELAIEAVVGAEFHRQEWIYPDGQPGRNDGAFDVSYFIVDSWKGNPVNQAFSEIRWVKPALLLTMDILEGNREAVLKLAAQNGSATIQ